MTKYTLMSPICTMLLLPFPNRILKIDCLLSSQSMNNRYIRELLFKPRVLIKSWFFPSNSWPWRSSTGPLTAQYLSWEAGIPIGKPHTYFLPNLPLLCILHSFQNLVCLAEVPEKTCRVSREWRRQTGSEDEFGWLPAAFIEKKGSTFFYSIV